MLKGSAKEKTEEVIHLSTFIDVKGWKSQGNKFTSDPRRGKVVDVSPTPPTATEETSATSKEASDSKEKPPASGGNLTLDF